MQTTLVKRKRKNERNNTSRGKDLAWTINAFMQPKDSQIQILELNRTVATI